METPASVRELLSEYNLPPGELGPEWETTVIERVMSSGRLADMRWLVGAFDQPTLIAFLARRGHRSLPPRELRFWSRICGVAPALADAWVAQAQAREREWLG